MAPEFELTLSEVVRTLGWMDKKIINGEGRMILDTEGPEADITVCEINKEPVVLYTDRLRNEAAILVVSDKIAQELKSEKEIKGNSPKPTANS